MKKIAGFIPFIVFSPFVFSQIQGDDGFTDREKSQLAAVHFQELVFPQPDIKKLQIEDAQNDEKGDGPWRFGFNNETSLTLSNAGTWTSLANGGKLWRLKIQCTKAQTINLTFENTFIPKGNELFVYNPDKSFILGKFTQKHLYEGQLGTELIPGDVVIVEYYVSPENNAQIGQLEIATVTHGYRIAEEFQAKAFGQAASCHMNVNCVDGVEFANQKRSVVMLVSGANSFCSGALINNTAYDGKPYVLTANHCYSNPATWVFRFNWESPDCTNPLTSPSFSSLSGAVLRARRTASDFCLVEITGGLEAGTVPVAYNAYFSGWDRTGTNPAKTFGIHHPRGDIKKISFDDHTSQPTQSTVSGVTSDPQGVWQVIWDRNTTTESVSSGSPLFDQNKRIIGQLWGGGASCTNLTGKDFYGRFFISWNPTGSDATNHLKSWLDPSNTGAVIVDGYQPGTLVSNDASLIQLKDINGTVCGTTTAPKVTLVNLGQTTMTAATINYGLDGLQDQVYSWTGNLPFLQSVEVTLPAVTTTSGSHSFIATIADVNGGADGVAGNNQVNSSLFVMDNPETIELSIDLDCYASETSWQLTNDDNVILYASVPYINADDGVHTYEFCLSEDCYTFTLMDSYGDGMNGCASGNGSFQLTNSSNTVLGEMTTSEANFGPSFDAVFCLGDASVNHLQTLFDVYPNPSNGKIYWNSDQVISLTVFDVQGKIIAKEKMEPLTQEYQLGALSNGLYLVTFELSNGQTSQVRIVFSKE
jgi:lysyl endopeptidase